MTRSIVWFRGKDLRLSDHGPLREALEGDEVIPLFVVDPFFFDPKRARELPHRMQFLLESLEALAANLEAKGSRLVVARGPSTEVVPALAQRWSADRVLAQRWVEPVGRERDRRVAQALASQGVAWELFEGETLLPPGSLRTGSDTPYAVYSPFARAHRAAFACADPLPVPRELPPVPSWVNGGEWAAELPDLKSLGIEHNPRLPRGGEKAARKRMKQYLAQHLSEYQQARDRLDWDKTSRLSADLKFGTLSIRTLWKAVSEAPRSKSRTTFENELLWREFAHSTLWDRPALLTRTFRPNYQDFPWGFDEQAWTAWVEGKTGYPVVDAAARQLLTEGFVHNRARMIAASFLTKHLLIHYRHGERHYLKHLVDGDWANNNMGWQWAAGCGADAQPYFRIFNPMTQGQKFDPNGEYVRRYVPELRQLSDRVIHEPWKATPKELSAAGIELGKTYPLPIVDHREARERFLSVAKGYLKG